MAMKTLSIIVFNLLIGISCIKSECKDQYGNKRCCYNFEEVNGTCVQCENGSTSSEGGRCLPCTNNMFGYKCLQSCTCGQYQTCDPVLGCVIFGEVTLSSVTNTELIVTNDTEKNIHQVTTSQRFSNKVTSVTALASENKTEVNNGMDYTTTINTDVNKPILSNWVIYIICTAGFIILIMLSHIIRTYRQKIVRSHKLARVINDDHITDSSEVLDNVYHEIDESELHMFDSAVSSDTESYIEPNTNSLHVIEINSFKDSEDNNHVDDDYLQPYHSSEGEQSDEKNSTKSDVTVDSSSLNIPSGTRSSYSNPYQPLKIIRQLSCHSYDVPVVVHVTETFHDDSHLVNREMSDCISDCLIHSEHSQDCGNQEISNRQHENLESTSRGAHSQGHVQEQDNMEAKHFNQDESSDEFQKKNNHCENNETRENVESKHCNHEIQFQEFQQHMTLKYNSISQDNQECQMKINGNETYQHQEVANSKDVDQESHRLGHTYMEFTN